VKLPTPSRQVPRTHGLEAQSLMFIAHVSPSHPSSQAHVAPKGVARHAPRTQTRVLQGSSGQLPVRGSSAADGVVEGAEVAEVLAVDVDVDVVVTVVVLELTWLTENRMQEERPLLQVMFRRTTRPCTTRAKFAR
jgi:hypothetical protein